MFLYLKVSYKDLSSGSIGGYFNQLGPCKYSEDCGLRYNLSALGYNAFVEYACCTGNNCNTKSSYCISSDLLNSALKNNTFNVTNAVISQSCNSNSITPSVKITISINLKVNLVYISDYSNLTSAASLLFIQNLTNFVSVSNKKS